MNIMIFFVKYAQKQGLTSHFCPFLLIFIELYVHSCYIFNAGVSMISFALPICLLGGIIWLKKDTFTPLKKLTV